MPTPTATFIIGRKRKATARLESLSPTESVIVSDVNSQGLFRRTSNRVLNAFRLGRVPPAVPHTPPYSPDVDSQEKALCALEEATRSNQSLSARTGVRFKEPCSAIQLPTPPQSPTPAYLMALDGEAKAFPSSKPKEEGAEMKPITATRSLPQLSCDTTTNASRGSITPSPQMTPKAAMMPKTPTSTKSNSSSLPGPSSKDPSSAAPSPVSTAKTTPVSSSSTTSLGTVRHNFMPPTPSSSGSLSSDLSSLAPIKESSCVYRPWPIQEAGRPKVDPTIETVERAAAAQVYLERYFNGLLCADTRSQRRRLLHKQLNRLPLVTKDLSTAATAKYNQDESAYLRQLRTDKKWLLKDKRFNQAGRFIAEYEVIRALGKGSFGTVVLVRTKEVKGCDPDIATARTESNESQEVDEENIPRTQIEAPETTRSDEGNTSGRMYAMKIIRKSSNLSNHQEGHLRAERDFLVAASSSRWVVPLIAAFQDITHLYLVMDYMIGGDFLGLLLREDILQERYAAFWLAEMILCVEETHRMGFIHRDVKPDNFLIDRSGHLKISDFGLSFDGHWAHDQNYYHKKRHDLAERLNIKIKGDAFDLQQQTSFAESVDRQHQRNGAWSLHQRDSNKKRPEEETVLDYLDRVEKRKQAHSVVGTSQYMAPEVVRADPNDPYDGRCDWWSIGIILYECLYGRTPFYSENGDRQATKHRICLHQQLLHFPDTTRYNFPRDSQRCVPLPPVTLDAVDLMRSLLCDKKYRLSSPKYQTADNAVRPPRRKNDLRPRTTSTPVLAHLGASISVQRSASFLGHRRTFGSSDTGNFVYPNDGEDIKNHSFFKLHRICFETIHKDRPPWVPAIHDSITEYFDEENEILTDAEFDIDPSSVDEDVDEFSLDQQHRSAFGGVRRSVVSEKWTLPIFEKHQALTNGEGSAPRKPNGKLHTNPNKLKRGKEPKRARDKILRDPVHGAEAMRWRKKQAFLGYTYRRPAIRMPVGGYQTARSRDRTPTARPTILPVDGSCNAAGIAAFAQADGPAIEIEHLFPGAPACVRDSVFRRTGYF